MAAISPGLSRGSSFNRKKHHVHDKNHKFEPFSKRIARLKIDPVHRVQDSDILNDDGQVSQSHFGSSVEYWEELNLSENFTQFLAKVKSKSETLPQILYHADLIVEHLFYYIGLKDAVSAEPLLSLLAHLAHDLGIRFEKYFADAVKLVFSVAATHNASEVIEWSFTCLAFMFKYLSRLLVPDLRPLLTIVTPYLGKAKEKFYVIRFAAESLSFLIRKAAAVYARKPEPLDNAVSFLFRELQDMQGERERASYQFGLMSIFAEVIQGVNGGLHSSCAEVLMCLLKYASELGETPDYFANVLEGVIISTIHNTNAEGFAPLAKVILDFGSSVTPQMPTSMATFGARIVLTIVGTRKGSRISAWDDTFQVAIRLIELVSNRPNHSCDALDSSVTTISAMLLQYAPLEKVLVYSTKIVELFSSPPLLSKFFPFCMLTDRIGRERFVDLVMPTLMHVIATSWEDDTSAIFLIVRRLSAGGLTLSDHNNHMPRDSRVVMHDRVLRMICLEEDYILPQNLPRDAFAQFAEDLSIPKESENALKYLEPLRLRVSDAASRPSISGVTMRTFEMGEGLRTYVRLASLGNQLDLSLWNTICDHADPPTTCPAFLAALSQYLAEVQITDLELSRGRKLLESLVENCLDQSLGLKTSTLLLMKLIARDRESQAILAKLSEILDITIGLQTTREMTMHIRRLVMLQKNMQQDLVLQKLAPYFCLGLLSTSPFPIAKEILSAISIMCEDTANEEIVTAIAIKWLQTGGSVHDTSDHEEKPPETSMKLTPYQCSNIQRIAVVSQESFDTFTKPKENLCADLRREAEYSRDASTQTPRLQALHVLHAISSAAEKRSRFLVPVFLSITPAQDYLSLSLSSAASTSSLTLSPEVTPGEWTLRERKAFVELFTTFKNPKALFGSQQVFNSLLHFLTIGNSDLQALSLKALFTWKMPAIMKYEERLLRLIDDKTYREELVLLFHQDETSTAIEDGDRETLMPILLRLLYGQMISRSGARSAHSSQEAKRKTILRALFRSQQDAVSQFIDIALGSVPVGADGEDHVNHRLGIRSQKDSRRELGVLKMSESMLETLKTQLSPFGEQVLKSVLRCSYRVGHDGPQSGLSSAAAPSEAQATSSRAIRKTSIRCLYMLFTFCDHISWRSYLPSIFEYLIRPRLERFSAETTQDISGLLQLFATWASKYETASYLHDYETSLLDKIADCLKSPVTKDDVKCYILEDIFVPLAEMAADTFYGEKVLEILRLHIQNLLEAIEMLLTTKDNPKLLDPIVTSLVGLSPFVDSSVQVDGLISAIIILFETPSNRVNATTKNNLLQAILNLTQRVEVHGISECRTRLRRAVSRLFDSFQDSGSRNLVVSVLDMLANGDEDEKQISLLCSQLNATSLRTVDEIDYDLRIQAFNLINAQANTMNSLEKWEPVVHNLIYFARDDDFVIRSNAISSLRRFILNNLEARQLAFGSVFKQILLSAVFKGAKAESELVRADHIALLGLLIQKCPDWSEISDMQGLLAANDEEASFFNNILHIQHHRRARGMRRLTAEADRGTLGSSNIYKFFIPLLELFVFDTRENDGVRDLRGHAIPAIGSLLSWVEWNQFRTVFGKYKMIAFGKVEIEKGIIKLLGVSADALASSASLRTANNAAEIETLSPVPIPTRLSKSLPNAEKLSQVLKLQFIPAFISFIHSKDESQITARIPVAITTVKLLKLLPHDGIAQLLPPLLLDIAYILRSRSQDSRDIARRTLAEIVTILGPDYLPFVLKELRTSLSRGYQLHVLSYTVHAILVSNADYLSPGDLDQSLDQLVAVIMDDVFGSVGQEKDAEEYISKMREVKSNKSFDSIELLAKSTSLKHLIHLIQPLQALLMGNVTSQRSRKVDELLRRMGVGLSRNLVAGSHDMLTFCYQVIQEVYQTRSSSGTTVLTKDEKNRQRFLVQMSGANKTATSQISPSMYKLTRFALDLFRSLLQKHDHLLKAEYVRGFLPVLGDSLLEGAEEVRLSAMRVITAIVRLPIPELEQNAGLYMIEAVKVVRASVNTHSEAAQAALKLAAAIVRELKGVQIRDSDVSYLLHRIIPDIEEPDRQGVSFNFIKAVMARKVMMPEVYDASEKISMIMITNHTQSIRDAARGIFVHFLLGFPQSKDRWNKQVKFLIKNLSYKHSEGRSSVMEAINLLLNKLEGDPAQDLLARAFIPLVMIVANDESPDCQRMAGILIGRCFDKADGSHLETMIDTLHTWIRSDQIVGLRKAGFQILAVYFDTAPKKAEREVGKLLALILRSLKEITSDNPEDDIEVHLHALTLLATITDKLPALVMTQKQAEVWKRVQRLLSSRQHSIRKAATRLIGLRFQDIVQSSHQTSLGQLPLYGTHRLELDAKDQKTILRSSIQVLRTTRSDTELHDQTARNIKFLGRCFILNDAQIDLSDDPKSGENGQEIINEESNSQGDGDGSDSGSGSDTNDKTQPKAIIYLISQLSTILRREPRHRPSILKPTTLPKTTSLQILTSLTPHVPPETLTPLLAHTLLPPLLHLSDPASHPTPIALSRNPQILTSNSTVDTTLPTLSSTLLSTLQSHLGSEIYIAAITAAQRFIRERRQERRVKRKVEAVADPEAAAREKRRRAEKEKRRLRGKREAFMGDRSKGRGRREV